VGKKTILTSFVREVYDRMEKVSLPVIRIHEENL